jgi:hypothetical protein
MGKSFEGEFAVRLAKALGELVVENSNFWKLDGEV